MKFVVTASFLRILCAMKNFWLIIFVVLFAGRAEAQRQGYEKEFVLISGGPSLISWEKFKKVPHDKWWGNFVRTARVRIEELQKQHGPDAKITWCVYKEGYEKRAKQEGVDLLSHIASVRDKYKVKLIYFNRTQELLDYLNYGQPRDRVKVVDLEYYGHSNRACFMFDYSSEMDSASKCYLHENDLKKINRAIFAKDAFVKSWGCHTGESMSQKFRSATGIRMYGAVGKTDYSSGFYAVLAAPKDRWAY